MTVLRSVSNFFRNPITVFFLLTAISNQGVIIQASFYFFQINNISIDVFGLMFIGLILAFSFGFLFGFDFTKFTTKYLLFFFALVHSILLLLLTFTFTSNINNTIIIYLCLGLVGGFLTLFTLVRSLMDADDENRIKITSKIVFIWFVGQALFGVLFIINIEGAIFLSAISSFLGTFGLYLLLTKGTENKSISFQKITLGEIFTPNILSLIILFSIYGLILFSYIEMFADQIFPSFSSFPGTIMGTILIGVSFSSLTSILIYILNINVSLKSTYSIIYILVSLSLFLLILDQNTIFFAFFLSVSIWSFFGAYIFTTFGDIYPKSQHIQLFSFWWLSLTLAFGGGILLPLIFTNQLHVLYFHLFLVLFSIFLLTYLSSLSTPLMVYYLTIFTTAGIPIYSKGYLELDKALVTGLLTGLMTMFREVFESGSNLQSIDHGDKKLIISRTDMLFGVLLINHVESQAIDKLKEITEMFEVSFHTILEKEPQRVSAFEHLPALLERKINFFEKN